MDTLEPLIGDSNGVLSWTFNSPRSSLGSLPKYLAILAFTGTGQGFCSLYSHTCWGLLDRSKEQGCPSHHLLHPFSAWKKSEQSVPQFPLGNWGFLLRG